MKLNFKELEFALGKKYKTERLYFGLSAIRTDTWYCGCIRTGRASMNGTVGMWQDEFTPCKKHEAELKHKIYPEEPVFQLRSV